MNLVKIHAHWQRVNKLIDDGVGNFNVNGAFWSVEEIGTRRHAPNDKQIEKECIQHTGVFNHSYVKVQTIENVIHLQ